MGKVRKNYSASFKAKVALEAVKKEKTISQLSSEYGVHSNQINQWRKRLLEDLPDIFSQKRKKKEKDTEELQAELYQQIGQLKVELDWLKKKSLTCSVDLKRQCIDPSHSRIPITRQCDLLGIGRSGYYYQSTRDDSYNQYLMRLIDEEYTRYPIYGIEKMTAVLRRQGHSVNPKRIRRLMRLMDLEAIYPKPNLSKPIKAHKIYPYLLRGVRIDRVDQVWSTDITYIRLKQGFIYLVAVIDWFSRYVLSHEFSTTLDTAFCIKALQDALKVATPGTFNTDQGSQFTSDAFTGILIKAGVKISMDGRGRALDNIFVERLWRSVKYERVYLHNYETVREAIQDIGEYFDFYNNERPHQSLDYHTPAKIYFNGFFQRKALL
ncbi:MAG: IS3 family transposase [Deltaproteobacteria bacterium]|nr:IS3 family transposase [Deltaproteobacteria bacterium]